ncbi:MAG: hypothetical protein ACREBT_04740 [Thermoplasmata archaeon]
MLMWDAIEMLVYDAQMLTLRLRALEKLSRAEVRFAERSPPAAAPGAKSGTGQI